MFYMYMYAKLLILGTIFLCVVPAGCRSEQPPAPSASTGMMQGHIAPDFTIADLNGTPFTLSSLRGKSNVLLVFWATWCPYCVVEIPRLKALHEKYKHRDVAVISVNVAANDPLPRVEAFQSRHAMPYPILYDSANIVSRLYGVQGIPVSLVIDRQGVIQFRGHQLPANIEDLFEQLSPKT
jgi:peroxiredoxin